MGKLLGGVPAALQLAVAVRGHPGDRLRIDSWKPGDEFERDAGQLADSVFLPRRDEPPDPLVIGDRCARGCKRDPPPSTFDAAPDRPLPGRAAALAPRRTQARQSAEASVAERRAARAAGHAAPREDEIEHRLKLRAHV